MKSVGKNEKKNYLCQQISQFIFNVNSYGEKKLFTAYDKDFVSRC